MKSVLLLSGCRVDLDARRVHRADQTVALTAQEAKLLAYLAACSGQTLHRAELFREVFGYAPSTRSRALDATIRRLRRKIEVDASRPEHLLTVRGEGYCLHLTPSPNRGLVSFPRWTDAFVGRANLTETVREEVHRHPLVTIHGPGGVGKTRLAVEALRALGNLSSGPPFSLICVEPGAEADTIAVEVASALGLETTRDPKHWAGAGLAAQGGTLVLDGAEAALEPVAMLVAHWVGFEGVRLVVTSRERLWVHGERLVAVGPLAEEAAVELLVVRALAARGGRTWSKEEDQTILVDIVRALDGLPLAVELAASRAPVLTARQLLGRLDERFSLLRRAGPSVPGHHATLDAAVRWSWDRMDRTERSTLVQLSVLPGPFEIGTVEALVDTEADVLEVIARLVSKSMLQPTDHHGRLRMLDSIKAFARSQARRPPWGAAAAAAHRRLTETPTESN